MKVILLTERKT